jgi:hypothetical protein
MKVASFQTSKTTNALMLKVEKMKRLERSLFTRDMVARTRDGRLSILTKLKSHKRKECMNLDSTSTDHSTSDLDFQ